MRGKKVKMRWFRVKSQFLKREVKGRMMACTVFHAVEPEMTALALIFDPIPSNNDLRATHARSAAFFILRSQCTDRTAAVLLTE